MPTTFNFSTALDFLKDNEPVCRTGWKDKSKCLELQTPDDNSKMSLPYIFVRTKDDREDDRLVPWVASQVDLMGEDWIKV